LESIELSLERNYKTHRRNSKRRATQRGKPSTKASFETKLESNHSKELGGGRTHEVGRNRI